MYVCMCVFKLFLFGFFDSTATKDVVWGVQLFAFVVSFI